MGRDKRLLKFQMNHRKYPHQMMSPSHGGTTHMQQIWFTVCMHHVRTAWKMQQISSNDHTALKTCLGASVCLARMGVRCDKLQA